MPPLYLLPCLFLYLLFSLTDVDKCQLSQPSNCDLSAFHSVSVLETHHQSPICKYVEVSTLCCTGSR